MLQALVSNKAKPEKGYIEDTLTGMAFQRLFYLPDKGHTQTNHINAMN